MTTRPSSDVGSWGGVAAAVATVLLNVGATFVFALVIGPTDDWLSPLFTFGLAIAMSTLAIALVLAVRGRQHIAVGLLVGVLVSAFLYVVGLGIQLSELS